MSPSDRPTAGGTYTLLVRLDEPATVEVGALGERAFPGGLFAYTGSALGPGGFARVDRHRELAAGERDTRHWHVDYLLGHPAATIERVVRSSGVDAECAVAASIDGEPVAGFGASDCDCSTHLHYGGPDEVPAQGRSDGVPAQGGSDGVPAQGGFVETVVAAHRAARDRGDGG